MYIPDGRGRSLPLKGNKQRLCATRGYLIVVNQLSQEGSIAAGKVQSVTVCDPENKFVAFDHAFTDVQHVLFEWGAIFVLCGDGKMFKLAERDFESKMEALFKKYRFEIAINLAKRQAQLNPASAENSDTLVQIYLQYGNHLYQKKRFDDAIRQYIKTIGKLEPSYVIRKFLDSQRIQNLTDYLQALHDCQLADKHHTTLLLNCYTKLKNEERLNEFIMTDKELNFDLTTAITVCRQAKYFKQALFLAKKFDQHEWYLRIQLENVCDYKDALDYIAGLPFNAARESMIAYGKQLLTELPGPCTELMQHLCTNYHPRGADATTAGQKANPEHFIALFVNQPSYLRSFLEHMIKERDDCTSKVYDTLLELYLREKPEAPEERGAHERNILELLRYHTGKYDEYQALVLTQLYDFKPGILYLFEKTEQYGQIVQYYMEKRAYRDVLEACRTYGRKD
jgi:hypothetical protein